MIAYVLLILAVGAFYWHFKEYGKEDFFSKATRGAKGFGRAFVQGVMEERVDEFRRKMNYYVVALLAKIAKSDGRVSEKEADMISQILNANAKDKREREFLKASFNEHKERLDDIASVAREFIKEVPLPHNERLNVLNVLIFMASIDGELNEVKFKLLSTIAQAFGIDDFESLLDNIKSYKSQNKNLSLKEAYEILGLSSGAKLDEVKKKYRELAKRYHPDVLNANNVSQAQLKEGARKFQQVNEAYELVKKHLGA